MKNYHKFPQLFLLSVLTYLPKSFHVLINMEEKYTDGSKMSLFNYSFYISVTLQNHIIWHAEIPACEKAKKM